MKIYKSFLFCAVVFGCGGSALADNAFTVDQLTNSIQLSAKDYAVAEPEMSKSISAVRAVTTGTNVVVTLDMNSDGMKMSAKYLCVPQAAAMNCQLQQ